MSTRKMVFVGNLYDGSNARSLCEGFEDLGVQVERVDTGSIPHLGRNPARRHARRQIARMAEERVSLHLAHLSRTDDWDALVCFKTIWLDQRQLVTFPASRLVHYSPDDVSNPANTSPRYVRHESQWDLIVTTKKHNVAEIESRSGVRVEYVLSAYDPRIHLSQSPGVERRRRVGFIGARRPDRAYLPRLFAATHPHQSAIYGPGWRASKAVRAKTDVLPGAHGRTFLSAAESFFATPVLLNAANRDTHTCRTFEAAASRHLLLLARTSEHEMLFEENRDALFFDDRSELTDLLRSLKSRSETEFFAGLAASSYSKVVRGGHTYTDRARQIMESMNL